MADKKLPVYRLTVNPDSEDAEQIFTALVDDPAIESNFVAFSKAHKLEFKVTDAERRIITGAAMIPDMLIYRNDKNGEYNVYFTKEDIELFVRKWAKNNRYNSVNEMHDRGQQPNGVYLIESFMVDSSRGISSPTKLDEKYPDGTWIQSYFVENDDVWEKAKAGQYRGFSVEAMFNYKFNAEKMPNEFDEVISILNNFILM